MKGVVFDWKERRNNKHKHWEPTWHLLLSQHEHAHAPKHINLISVYTEAWQPSASTMGNGLPHAYHALAFSRIGQFFSLVHSLGILQTQLPSCAMETIRGDQHSCFLQGQSQPELEAQILSFKSMATYETLAVAMASGLIHLPLMCSSINFSNC